MFANPFDLHFPDVNYVGYFLTGLLTILVSSFGEASVQIFCPFSSITLFRFYYVTCLFITELKEFFHIFWIPVLCQIHVLQTLFQNREKLLSEPESHEQNYCHFYALHYYISASLFLMFSVCHSKLIIYASE